MAVKNKWAILFAGIAGILSVWGYWGGGTAAGLLPEKDKNIEVSSASGEASDGFSEGRMDGGSRKVYDAALHRREGPMKDPFHVAGIEAVAAEAASAAGKTHAAPLGNTAPSVKTDSESIKQTPLLPELKGIIYFGEEKRAIAELGGVVKTLKEGEQIVDILSIIGAYNSLFEFENVRIVKDMRNNVNRLVNCETANLSKTVNAAVRQVESIKLIEKEIGLGRLSKPLRDIAELRIEYPDESLKELGEMLNPPVGKSGVNHRLRRISEMADSLRQQTV